MKLLDVNLAGNTEAVIDEGQWRESERVWDKIKIYNSAFRVV